MAYFTKIADRMYEGASTDTKPTGVPNGTICRYTDTLEVVITYDGGTTYINADKRLRLVEEDGSFIDLPAEFLALATILGEVQASPTANTLLARAKTLATLIGEIQDSPTENTLLERLKALETAVVALPGALPTLHMATGTGQKAAESGKLYYAVWSGAGGGPEPRFRLADAGGTFFDAYSELKVCVVLAPATPMPFTTSLTVTSDARTCNVGYTLDSEE